MNTLFPDQNFSWVHRHVLKAHRQSNAYSIVESGALLITIAAGFFLFMVLLNLLFEIPSAVRWVVVLLFLSGLLLYFYFRILPLLQEILRPSRTAVQATAKKIGYYEPMVQDAVLNYLQLQSDQASSGSSRIKKLAMDQLYQRISHHTLQEKFQPRKLLPFIRLVSLALAVLLVIYLLFPVSFVLAVKKTLLPGRNFIEPFPVILTNTSGDISILKNDPASLGATSTGVIPDKLFLMIEEADPAASSGPGRMVNRVVLDVSPAGEYRYELSHVHRPFRYYFVAEVDQPRFRNRRAVSESGMVSVQDRPLIRSLQVKISPPFYTGLEPVLLEPDDGEITALTGSEVQLNIESDKQLQSAAAFFSDSTRLTLQVTGHTARGSFPVRHPLNYFIHIVDSDSIDNGDPVTYGIYVMPDEYPYAEIKQPGADVDLQDQLELPLIIEMRDDYGFSGLWLKGMVFRNGSSGDSSTFELKVPFQLSERGRASAGFTWDLIPFYLVPDDFIQYYAEVYDNDRITGPKLFRTQTYIIRLPSLLEILTRAEEQQENQLDQLEQVAQESQQLKQKLQEINRELKKETELNWERQQEIKKQLNRQKEVRDKLSEIQKEVESLVKEMDDQQVLSPESLQKYMELQQMFQELAAPELQKMIEELQQALEKADLNEVRKSLENMQFSLEQFEKSIERMHELFKRVQLEQRMDELIMLAEKLNLEQGQVNDQLNKDPMNEETSRNFSSMEQNVGQTLEFFEERLAETGQLYQQVMNDSSRGLEKARAYLDSQQTAQTLKQMLQQLQEQQQSGASQSGDNLKTQFEMLQTMVQMAKQDMMMQQQEQLTQAMQKVMQDMLKSSFDQEQLAQRSEKLNSASPQITDMARQQSRLLGNTRQMVGDLVEIGNKTFLLSPQLNQNMAEIMASMAQSINQLENRNPGQSSQFQKKAMAGLNQALLSMQNSMNQLGESSSSTGFEEFLESMKELATQQGQLNQQGMSMFKMSQNGKMSLSSDALARLAAQQEMIRQSLENLADGAGNRRDVLGRLDELGSEMEEVVKQLQANNMDRQLLERQERILSRMLDAQKSIREKEYSRKREAERETFQLVKSPPELRKEWLLQEDRLRKQLMEAMEEGYSLEYRELIKSYFEILSRQPSIMR